MNLTALLGKIEFECFIRTFHFHLLRGKGACSIGGVLEELREVTTKASLQLPRKHISEEHKVDDLYDAVISENWDQSALTNRYTNLLP